MSRPADPASTGTIVGGLLSGLTRVVEGATLPVSATAEVSVLDHTETVLEIGSAVPDVIRRDRRRTWFADVHADGTRGSSTATSLEPPADLLHTAAALSGTTIIRDSADPAAPPECPATSASHERHVTEDLEELARDLARLQDDTGFLLHGTVGHTRDLLARREPGAHGSASATEFWHLAVVAESPSELSTSLPWQTWTTTPTMPADLRWWLGLARDWADLPPARVPAGALEVLFAPAAVHALLTPVVGSRSGSAITAGRSFLPETGCAVVGRDVDLVERATPLDGADGTADTAATEPPLPRAAVDDEGVSSGDTVLLDRGRTADVFHTRRSAAACGRRPTGHGFRGTVVRRRPDQAVSPTVNDAVLEVAHGLRADAGDLIGGIRRGLVVESLQGETQRAETSPIVRGRVRFGLLVENGRATGRLSNQAVTIDVRDVLGDRLVAASHQRWPVSRGWSGRLPFVLTGPSSGEA